MADTEDARRRFAGWLREQLSLPDALYRAFATVERERYLGPPPWKIRHLAGGPRVEQTSDPSELYVDRVISIDESRQLNNGQPSLHAGVLPGLGLQPGEHVVHVGSGTGYYTAVLAELVGAGGRVTAIELDPELAERTRANTAHLAQVEVRAGDGTRLDRGEADAFYACAGLTHVPALWLERLHEGERCLSYREPEEGA
jgi:protein-L-isoaspartate(D-aspartate) O-methyltransferase